MAGLVGVVMSCHFMSCRVMSCHDMSCPVFYQAFKATPTADDILTVLCGLAGSYTRPILVLFGNGISSEITFSISRIEP